MFINRNFVAFSRSKPALRALGIVSVLLFALNTNSMAISAVPVSDTKAKAPAVPARSVKKPVHTSTQRWTDLTTAQRLALAPLAAEWDKLEPVRQQKWLVLANKFPHMKPDAQQRVQDRMHEWVKLTPEQRRLARENYSRTKKLHDEQKSVQWERYQQLPEEQRKKLAASAENKKKVANLPRPVISKNKPLIQPGSTATQSLPDNAVAPPNGNADSSNANRSIPATK